MKSSLPTRCGKIITDEERLLSFNTSLLQKDFSVKLAKQKNPELSKIIDILVNLVAPKNYITVDVMKHVFNHKTKTCSNTYFHIDGENNNYAILNIGVFRTEFLMEAIEIDGLGNISPRDASTVIKKTIEEKFLCDSSKKMNILEAESGVPYLYDSFCIHRGRIADPGGKRLMIRVCSSDYIRPKNVILKR